VIKLRFGKTGQAEPLPPGRLVTSFEPPAGPAAGESTPANPPAPQAPSAPQAFHVPSEEGLDALANLVIERLSQSPLPDSIARIVTEVSERLVREEIARIREKSRTPPSGSNAGSF
jgi:hypothetical protein